MLRKGKQIRSGLQEEDAAEAARAEAELTWQRTDTVATV